MKQGELVALVAVAGVAAWLFLEYEGATSYVDSMLTSILSGGAGAGAGGDASDLGQTILSALASFENVATFHNNPGGICGSFTAGVCNGPATFPSLTDGIGAAANQIDVWINDNPAITVEQFVAKWSGATGQVLQNYVTSVSNSLGLDPDEPIADAGGSGD